MKLVAESRKTCPATSTRTSSTQLTPHSIGWCSVFLALLLCLLLAGSASAATYDVQPSGGDDTDEIEAAINATEAAGGGTVSLEPGTYRVDSAIDLQSNVTLEGNGAVLYMTISNSPLLKVGDETNSGVRNLTLRGATIGLLVENSSNVRVENLRTEDNDYGSRFAYSSHVTVKNHVSRGDVQAMTAKWTNASAWTDLDFDCKLGGNGHNIYLERGNTDLSFTNVRLAGGGGYSLHLYHEGTEAENSKRISFQNVYLDNPTMGIVVWGYEDVSFRNVRGSAKEGVSPVMLNSLNGFTMEDFDLAGGAAAVTVYRSPGGAVRDVVLKEGIYHQPKLIQNEENVGNLVVDDVAKR